MNPTLIVLLIVGFFAFLWLILRLGARHSEKVYQRTAAFADRLGLVLERVEPRYGFWPQPTAVGTLNGRSARLHTYVTGSGKSRATWTALEVNPRGTGGLTFKFSRQGFESKIAEIFGVREITVGDANFDQAWFIRTNQPEFLRAALIPEVRAALDGALAGAGLGCRGANFQLEQNAIVYSEIGDFSDERRSRRFEQIPAALAALADVAEVHARQAGGGV